MIKDIREINFPSYATIYKADPNLQDMGEMTISTQLEIDGNITPDFSYDWTVLFQGSKYIAPLRNPQGAKDSEQLCATYELVFQHWAIYQLKRWLFFTVQSDSATTNVVVPDKYIADEQLNLGNLCTLISRILEFYFGETITIDLNPNWEYDPEPKTISISHSFIWDVIVQLYELFGVHWQIVPNGDSEHYVIRVGYSGEDITHVFEYGFEGGLMKIERQVQDENIRNILIARGGEDNIPFRYYKDVDPNNDSFPADPDWISELKTTSFDRLRNATFRSYVQGWKAAHIADYPGYTAVGESRAYAPWAYKKGFEDKNFDPVEYVADKILTSGTLTTQISPTYSPYIEKGSSIDKYGPLQGILDNDDDCIPTIQGVEDTTLGRIDEVVYCEQVTSDDIQEIPTSEHYTKKFWDNHEYSLSTLEPEERKEFSIQVGIFTVPKGKNCNFDVDMAFIRNSQWIIFEDSYYIVAVDQETNKEYGGAGLPEGTYTLYIKGELCNTSTDKALSADFRISVTYTTFVPASTKGRTWDIWIKNIWGTFLALDESPEQYAERVWLPILGNHLGDEAAVMFSTGALSVSDDYEFLIAKMPEYDDSKSIQSSDGKTYQSHWKITLVRSDADYESLGVYTPSTQRQGKAGDKFLFTGIELPHNYVLWAERKIDERATDKLDKVKDIKPTFVVEFDPLRLHGIDTDRTLNDLSKYIKPGASLLIKDKRLTNNDTERLTIQSVQYHYGAEEDSLLPNIEVTLGTTYQTSGGTIQQMQGDIESLQRMVGSVSNIRQVVLSTGEKYFLSRTRNDRASGHVRFANGLSIGTSDSDKAASVDTAGNAEFNSLIVRTLADIYDSLKIRGKLTALASASISGGLYSLYPDFVSGFSGQGWAIENGTNGESRAEFDTLTIRKALTVYELIIRKIRSVGGAIICSAANGKIKSVETSGDNYVITFEDECQFQADDLMRCQTFTGNTLKSYWVRITSATTESVTIAKSEFNGTTPEIGDECVLMGNATNDKRQSAIYISAAEDGRPVIDILNGIKTASTAGCLRGRFGALDGISDSAFPKDHQPQGYGLYSDNAYLKGEFILASTGENVSTLIAATNGTITAEISKVQSNIDKVQSNVDSAWNNTQNALNVLDFDIQGTKKDVRGLTTSVDSLDKQIKDDYATLNAGLDTLKGSIADISTDLSNAEERLDGKIDKIDGKIDDTNDKITDITTNYDALTTRVTQNEEQISLQAQRITSVTTTVTEVKNDTSNSIKDLTTKVEGANDSIANLDDKIGEVDSKVDGASSSIKDLNSKVDGANNSIKDLNGKVDGANSSIKDLNDKVNNVNSDIKDLNDKVDANQVAITETITAMEARFNVRADEISSEVTKVTSEVTTVTTTVNSVKTEVETVKSDVESVQSDVESVQSDVTKVTTKVGEVTTEVNGVKENISDIETDVKGVKSSVYTVTSEVGTVKSNISELQTNVSTVKTDINGVKSDVDGVKTDISTVQTDVNGVKSDVSTVKSDIDTVKSDVNTVQTDISKAQADIADVQTDITNVNTSITNINKDVDQVKLDIVSVNGSIESVNGNLNTINTDLKSQIKNINRDLNNINTYAAYLSDKIESNKKEQDANLEDFKTDTNTKFGDVNGSINDLETATNKKFTNINDELAGLNGEIDDVRGTAGTANDTANKANTTANNADKKADEAKNKANEVANAQVTITETITAMSSKFDIKAEEISSEVTKVSRSISSSGRNMLLNTNQGTTNWRYSDNSGITSTKKATERGGYRVTRPSADRKATWERFDYALRPQLIIAGQKYTISFKVTNSTSESAKTQFSVDLANQNNTEKLTNEVQTVEITGAEEALFVVTLTAVKNGTAEGIQVVNIFPKGECMNQWTDIEIRDLQLERGEIATEYMPSNEDYVNETKQVLTSSINQTAESINMSVTSLESNVNSMQDEVDAVNSGLKTTGIDIRTGEVTISADKVTFTNSNGVKQALLTNGKLNAKALESESLTVQNAANENQRIEILPQSGKFGMNIYNGLSLVQSLTADTYDNGASDLFSKRATSPTISNTTGSASTGNASSAKSPVILFAPTAKATAPTSVFITAGTLSATAKCSIPTSSSGLQQTYQSTANITLDLQHSSSASFSSDVVTINLSSAQASVSSVGVTSPQSKTSTVNAVNGMGTVPAGRYFRVVMSFVYSANGTPISTNSASVSWSGIAMQYWSNEYLSRHFANGIVLGSSTKDYFDVHYDSNDAFTMRMETGGSGLLVQTKVDEYTNDMATLIGGYQAPMQRLICHGFVKYLAESGYKMHYQGLRINNGSAVSLKYPSGGTYRTMLAFSNDFKALLERLLGEDYTENNNANNEHYCGLEKHLFCHINTRSTTNVRAVTSLTTDGFITDAVGAYEDFTFDIYFV